MHGAKTAYISLGSNLGDRAALIARGMEAMAVAGIRVVRQSSLYETEPVDVPAQPWFLNAVVQAETVFMPKQLLRALATIERSMGRRRSVVCGPRTLDLDILLYGSSIIHTSELDIPHPRLTERRFVLVPLVELQPTLRHPASRKTMAELLADVRDVSQVKVWRLKRDDQLISGGG